MKIAKEIEDKYAKVLYELDEEIHETQQRLDLLKETRKALCNKIIQLNSELVKQHALSISKK